MIFVYYILCMGSKMFGGRESRVRGNITKYSLLIHSIIDIIMAAPPAPPAPPPLPGLTIMHQFAPPLPEHLNVQGSLSAAAIAAAGFNLQDVYTIAANPATGAPAIEGALSALRKRPITFGMLRGVYRVQRYANRVPPPANPGNVTVPVRILELYLELLVTQLENGEYPW
jgi:hypothetical protein